MVSISSNLPKFAPTSDQITSSHQRIVFIGTTNLVETDV